MVSSLDDESNRMDATATGSDELGIAFQKVGGTAGALGIKFEKVSSWLAQISATTRESAETIGDGVKSILARFTSLKEKGFTEDGIGINQVSKALHEAGIALTDQQGQFRNIGTVMDELGAKWGSLDSRTRAYLQTTVAGTYQSARFQTLMEGYTESTKLYEGALDSAGTSQQKFNIYQQSMDAKLNNLKNTWQDIQRNAFNGDSLKGLVDIINKFAKGIGWVVENVGLLKASLIGVATYLASTSQNMKFISLLDGEKKFKFSFSGFEGYKNYTKAYSDMIKEISLSKGEIDPSFLTKMSASMSALTTTTTAQKLATIGLTITQTALNAVLSMGIGVIITGIVVAIGKWINRNEELAKSNEELLKSTKDSVESHNSNIKKLQSMKEEYNNVTGAMEDMRSKGLTPSVELQEKYNSLNHDLAQMFPDLVTGYDSQGNAILNLKGGYDALIQSQKDKIKLDNEELLSKNKGAYDVAKAEQDKITQLMNGKHEYSGVAKFLNEKTILGGWMDKWYGKEEKSLEQMDVLKAKLQDAQNWYKPYISSILSLNQSYDTLSDSSKKLITDFTNTPNIFKNLNLEQIRSKIDSEIKKIASNPEIIKLDNLVKLEGKDIGEKQVKEYFANIFLLAKKTKKTPLELTQMYPLTIDKAELAKGIQDYIAMLEALMSKEKNKAKKDNYQNMITGAQDVLIAIKVTGQEQLDDGKAKAEEFKKAMEDLTKSFDESVASISDFNKYTQEYNENGKFSAETVKDIIDKHKDLAVYLGNEPLLYKKIGEAITKSKEEANKAYREMMISSEAYYSANIKGTDKIKKALGEYYNKLSTSQKNDLENAKTLAESKMIVEKALISRLNKAWTAYNNAVDSILSKHSEMAEQATKGDITDEETTRARQNLSRMIRYDKTAQSALTSARKVQAEIDSINTSFDKITADIKAPDIIGNTGVKDNTKAKKENTEASKEATAEQKRLTQAVREALNANKDYENSIKAIDILLKQIEINQSKLNETSQAYQNSIIDENKLIDKKIALGKSMIATNEKNLKITDKLAKSANNAKVKAGSPSASGATSQLAGQKVVDETMKYLGTPYVWGGTNTKGFDCSGLVQYVYKQLGKDISRTTSTQVREGAPVSKKNLKQGDLVFFSSNGKESGVHHVGVYAGDGKFLHAPRTGDVVKESNLNSRKDFYTGRRILNGNVIGKSPITGFQDNSTIDNGSDSLREKNEKIRADLVELNQKKAQNFLRIYDSKMGAFDKAIARYDNYINLNKTKASQFEVGSDNNMKYLGNEIQAVTNKEIVLGNKIKFANEQLKNTQLDSKKIQQIKADLVGFQNDLIGTTNEVKNLKDALELIDVNRKFKIIDSQYADDSQEITDIKFKMQEVESIETNTLELTKQKLEWTKQLIVATGKESNEMMTAWREAIKIRDSIKDKNSEAWELSNNNVKKYSDALKGLIIDGNNLKKSLIEMEKQIKEEAEKIEKKLFDMIKKRLELEKEQKLKNLEDDNRNKERAHKAEMQRLNDEKKLSDDIFSDKLKQIDALEDARVSDNKLSQLQRERGKLQNESNALSRDTSDEGLKRQRDLAEELRKKDEEISELLAKESYEKQKKDLQDKKELYDRDVENQIQSKERAEDERKQKLDDEKRGIDELYKNLMENEKIYNQVQLALRTQTYTNLSGQLVSLQESLIEYLNKFEDGLSISSETFKKELIPSLEKLTELRKQLDASNISVNVPNKSQATNNIPNYIVDIKPTNNGIYTEAEAKEDFLKAKREGNETEVQTIRDKFNKKISSVWDNNNSSNNNEMLNKLKHVKNNILENITRDINLSNEKLFNNPLKNNNKMMGITNNNNISVNVSGNLTDERVLNEVADKVSVKIDEKTIREYQKQGLSYTS